MVVHALLEALRDRDDAIKSQMMAICDYDADSFLPQLKAHYFSMQTPTVVCQLCRHDDPQIGCDSASRRHLGHELCIS
jgi:hypothetical protein